MTTIHVAHSPDSDDAFMFYALAAGKIDTEGLTYVHELQDIETLNQRAMRGELEVTAVSIHAYAYLSDKYALLPHGASMGDRYGPRLVARTPMSRDELCRQVWKCEFRGTTRTIDQTIATLRKKLPATQRIVTVYRVGYSYEK